VFFISPISLENKRVPPPFSLPSIIQTLVSRCSLQQGCTDGQIHLHYCAFQTIVGVVEICHHRRIHAHQVVVLWPFSTQHRLPYVVCYRLHWFSSAPSTLASLVSSCSRWVRNHSYLLVRFGSGFMSPQFLCNFSPF